MPLSIKNKGITALIFYLVLVFYFYNFFISKYCIDNFLSNYAISDLLINYEGGFIRRGLLGAIYFFFSKNYNFSIVNLIHYSFVFLYFIYLFTYFFFIKELTKNNFIILIFIIISPLGILYPIYELESLLRKEVFLYISFLIFLILLEKQLNEKIYIIYLNIIFPIIIFIHEGLFFLLIIFFLAWSINNTFEKKKLEIKFIFKSLITLVPVLILHFSYIIIGNSHDQINLIIKSLQQIDYKPIGAFVWLERDLLDAIQINFKNFKLEFLIRYIFLIFLSFCPLVVFFKKINIFNKNNIIFLILCILSFVLIFLIVLDWGRFISVIFNLFSFLLIFCLKKYNIKIISLKKNFLFLFFILIFSTTWNPKTTFLEEINLLPTKDLIQRYFDYL